MQAGVPDIGLSVRARPTTATKRKQEESELKSAVNLNRSQSAPQSASSSSKADDLVVDSTKRRLNELGHPPSVLAPESPSKRATSFGSTTTKRALDTSIVASAGEGATPSAVYVTDVIVAAVSEKPPPNSHAIRYIGDATPFAIGRGVQIWLERSANKPPITAICIYYPNKGENPPPGFVSARVTKQASDLYFGPPTARAMLAICRGDGAPILDAGLCSATHVPSSWTGLDRSPLGFKANIGSRLSRSMSAGSSGGTLICVRFDLSDMQRFLGDEVIRMGQSEGDSTNSASSTRRTSLIGQMFNSNANPLRKAVLTRRATANAGVSGKTSMTEMQQMTQVEGDSIISSTNVHTLTRLQRARERVLGKVAVEEGLGMNYLAFDPEVAGLMVSNSQLLERVLNSLKNIVRGSVLDALIALRELEALVRDGTVAPNNPLSEQMSIFDFVIAYGASQALERGLDVLIAPACRIVLEGCLTAKGGLHPVALHHALSSLLRGRDFFTRVKDDFVTFKAQVLAQETLSYNTPPSSVTPTSVPTPVSSPMQAKSERFPSTDRLDSLVSRLAGLGSPGVPSVAPLNAKDVTFHFLFPAETAEQMLGDRAFVLVQASQGVFQSLCDHATEFMKMSEVDLNASVENLESVVERLETVTSNGAWLIETSLEAYLLLCKSLHGASPVVDLVFALLFTAADQQDRNNKNNAALQDILLRAAQLESPIIGFIVRRIIFPMTLRKLALFINDDDAFGQGVELLSILWRSYRKYLKAELAVTLHSLVIPCLRDHRLPPWIRLRMAELVASWMDTNRACLAEMHINFDSESPVPHWSVFSDLFDTLCAVASARPRARRSSMNLDKKRHLSTRSSIEFDSSWSSRVSLESASVIVSSLRQLVNLSGTFGASSVEESPGRTNNYREAERHAKETLARALQMAKAQESAKAAVNYLIASGHLAEAPQAVAQFLRLHLEDLGEGNVGDYLGEGGKTSTEQAFMTSLRDCYVKAAPRNGSDSFDQSLRRFLTKGGFRLPGEGQKVERLLEAFARRFCKDHPEFNATDESVLILAFSVVMLNTDLHKPQIKQKAKMRKEDFIRNVSGINDGQDFPKDFLSDLYDSIARSEIRFNETKTQPPPLNHDGGESEGSTDKEQRYSWSAVDALDDGDASAESDALVDVQRELERGLSIIDTLSDRHFEFKTTLTKHAVIRIFESLSAKTFQFVSDVLENAASPFDLIAVALDTLEYAIGVSLFLEITGSERRAFASLLSKMVLLYGVDQPESDPKTREEQVREGKHLQLDWYIRLMESRNANDAGELLSHVHTLATLVAEKAFAAQQQQTLRLLAMRLNYPELLATNSERTFIREGALQIKSRDKLFFLFSDCILRVDVQSGKLRVEEELPIRTLRVLDDEYANGDAATGEFTFEIRSPLSTWKLSAHSRREKEGWMRDVNTAIVQCAEASARFDTVLSPSAVRSQPSGNLKRFPPSMSALENKFKTEQVKSSAPAPQNRSPAGSGLVYDISVHLASAKTLLVDERLDKGTKLLIYGYYKQATKGDCQEEEPREDIQRAKWHAWRAHKGMTKDEAVRAFVRLVKKLDKPSST